ncbi:Mechanosensitive ion channel MscS [Moorella glycerini]|uniref:MscS family protein YfkC n=1 Tax=Neomoorella stamsii TaxID=1266720 RepID=A0A9X7P4V2_9FIRM|nr:MULTISPECIES: mechanosensitive ion channel family protein [Moorella]PRR68744.1 putative MscS family protein YfkC [Moorella stamsii]CEP68390.1 Mechanosensitive ion channel MscS [Moorella glycerini]
MLTGNITWLWQGLQPRLLLFLEKLFWAAVIMLAALVVLNLVSRFIHRLFRVARRDPYKDKTLETLLASALRYLIYAVAVMLALEQFVDITPIIAGAGVLGLAIGFGAQSLVKDIITGFFIIFEDQFHVGDFVEINGQVTGKVEELGLRLTTIREWSGKKFYIANSEIKTVRNYNREELRAIVTATFPFEEDPRKIREVLEQACREVEKEYYQEFIQGPEGPVEPPQIYGVTDIDKSDKGGQFTITALTKPGSLWTVERALREKIWQACRDNGIRLAYPTRVYVGSEPGEEGIARGEYLKAEGR